MLTLTENASTIVKTIVEQQGGGDEAGLRFSQAPDSSGLAVSAVPAGEPGDQLVEADGAKVFLEESAAQLLEEQVLDAHVGQSGSVEFSLTPAGDDQPSPPA